MCLSFRGCNRKKKKVAYSRTFLNAIDIESVCMSVNHFYSPHHASHFKFPRDVHVKPHKVHLMTIILYLIDLVSFEKIRVKKPINHEGTTL